ncbi:AraC family transcriptional regulator [Paraburkholderia pallida]|uniref:AraC family transcriptional regulator n=1 Tax=Paraburkholderia pallida TaxID=2547399 RepID=A0A4P7CZ46_9BURK|nr:AraC family transcriptional regulator [Paraburkholderia pallida]QBQ99353.1 AraC family transcriptional regulator [Paraburkholderia pallida]
MSRAPVTLSIVSVQGLLCGLRSRGAETPEWIEAALVDARIDPALLDEAGARVTAEQYATLLSLLIERRDDEGLGLFSRRLRRGSFALVARSALGAPSLATALRRAARTFSLLQDDVRMDCVGQGGLSGLALEFHEPQAAAQNFLHEFLLRTFWQFLAWLHGGRLPPRRFDFSFDQPAYAAIYAPIFPAPLQFAQAHSAVWFDADLLAAPVRRDEQAFRAAWRDVVPRLIVPKPGEHAFSARVREQLQLTIPAWPDLETIAQRLHVSASTMQRHLAAEGTSYQALKDRLRRDLAIMRLTTSAVPVATLAAELGFADSAAFQRAFKSWTGSPAGSYRQR